MRRDTSLDWRPLFENSPNRRRHEKTSRKNRHEPTSPGTVSTPLRDVFSRRSLATLFGDVVWFSDRSELRPTLPAIPLRRRIHRAARLAAQRSRGLLVIRSSGWLGDDRSGDGVGGPLRRRHRGAGWIARDQGLELGAAGAALGAGRLRTSASSSSSFWISASTDCRSSRTDTSSARTSWCT